MLIFNFRICLFIHHRFTALVFNRQFFRPENYFIRRDLTLQGLNSSTVWHNWWTFLCPKNHHTFDALSQTTSKNQVKLLSFLEVLSFYFIHWQAKRKTDREGLTKLCVLIMHFTFVDFRITGVFDLEIVGHQVKYLGLMENLRVRRAGFAYRRKYETFLDRYKSLCPHTWPRYDGPASKGVAVLMKYLGYTDQDYQLGKYVIIYLPF